MTIASKITAETMLGDGANREFPFTFRAWPAEIRVVITAPDIAENGAVVPVGVVSNLPKTEQIVIMIEKNPNMVAATFTLPEGTVADVQTRVKMGQTSDVYAMVKADGKFYMAKKEVKVTLGGCGG